MGDVEELSLLDKFVAWFEDQQVGSKFDAFIEQHAKGFLGATTEEVQELSRTELYQQCACPLPPVAARRRLYALARAADEKLFDGLLDEFVAQSGTTKENFLKEAEKAEGMSEIYLQIFLAHAEYDVSHAPAHPRFWHRAGVSALVPLQVFLNLMAEKAAEQAARN